MHAHLPGYSTEDKAYYIALSKPAVMKYKNSFLMVVLSGLAVLAFGLLTGFAVLKTPAVKTIKLTIRGEGIFNVIVSGGSGPLNPIHKLEQDQRPPYEMDLPVGEYAIVVVRTSPDGEIISKIQNYLDGEPKGYAMSSDKVTLLQVYSDGGIGASGMK